MGWHDHHAALPHALGNRGSVVLEIEWNINAKARLAVSDKHRLKLPLLGSIYRSGLQHLRPAQWNHILHMAVRINNDPNDDDTGHP